MHSSSFDRKLITKKFGKNQEEKKWWRPRGDKMSWWEIDVWHSVVDVYGKCWEMDSIWHTTEEHIFMHLNQRRVCEIQSVRGSAVETWNPVDSLIWLMLWWVSCLNHYLLKIQCVIHYHYYSKGHGVEKPLKRCKLYVKICTGCTKLIKSQR